MISDRNDDDTTWLVAFDDDSGPVKFYTWDRAAKTATFLFDHRPQLNEYPLVPMEPFTFTARDGLRSTATCPSARGWSARTCPRC